MDSNQTTRQALISRLSPDQIRVSPHFRAVLGAMLGVRWTTPTLAEITTTCDGLVLGRLEGGIGYDVVVGSAEDLERNVTGISRAAGLSQEETALLLSLARQS